MVVFLKKNLSREKTKEKKKKKSLAERRQQARIVVKKRKEKKENMRRKKPLHWKWEDLDFHCHFIFILCDLEPSI